MGLAVEKYYPLVMGILTAGLSAGYLPHNIQERILRELLNPAINISAIIVGFLATAKSILVSIQDKSIIRKLKTAKLYETTIDYMATGIRASFALALISGLSILIDPKTAAWWLPHVIGIWVGTTVFTMASVYRVIEILTKILRYPDN